MSVVAWPGLTVQSMEGWVPLELDRNKTGLQTLLESASFLSCQLIKQLQVSDIYATVRLLETPESPCPVAVASGIKFVFSFSMHDLVKIFVLTSLSVDLSE